jgi:hypothetical protein
MGEVTTQVGRMRESRSSGALYPALYAWTMNGR